MDALALFPELSWPGDGTILAEALASLARARSETLVVTLHDQGGRFLCFTRHKGGATGVELKYRDLIECALANRATGLLLVHNHPSGDHAPSAADIAATRALAALCRPLGLVLHDHLIVGASALTSMARAGLFANSRKKAA